MRRLTSSKRAVLFAIGNAALLAGFAGIHFVDARMPGIVYSWPSARCIALGSSRAAPIDIRPPTARTNSDLETLLFMCKTHL
jgi:hypothetical protein